MNYDIVIESLRLLVTIVIVLTLARQFRERHLEGQAGLPLIRWGFGLILFGTVLDLSDNFHSLDRFVIIGDTETEAILEKLVGYLGGFILLAVGLVRWLPLLRAGQSARDRLATIHDSINDALLVHTVDDLWIIEVNQKACDMFGYTRKEFQSLRLVDLSSAENPDSIARAIEHSQLAVAGQPQIFEWLAGDKAGCKSGKRGRPRTDGEIRVMDRPDECTCSRGPCRLLGTPRR